MFSRVFIAFALIVVPTVWCYSSGAPAQACGDMTPQHGVDPQSSNAPYKLYPSTKSIRSGGSVDLELKGDANGNTFKGFFVQARIGDTPVGQFKVDANDKYVQAVNCGGGNKNAVTHKKIFGNGPSSVKFTWVAPPEISGDVEFYATVALNGGIFWVGKIREQVKLTA